MGEFVARQTVKALIEQRRQVDGARVAVLGVTFKENVPDIRNSRVPDIVRELTEYGVRASVWDPVAAAAEVEAEYGVKLCDERELAEADAVVLAVAHHGTVETAIRLLEDGRTVVCADVKGVLDRARVPKHVRPWRL